MLDNLPRTLEWVAADQGEPAFLRLIDQRKLPHDLVYLDCKTSEQVCDAIATLAVRGAPAIGDSGAYALVIWALNEWAREAAEQGADPQSPKAFMDAFTARADHIANVRPTAVNLSWAVNQCVQAACNAANEGAGVAALSDVLLACASKIEDDDRRNCKLIGEVGADEFAAIAERLGRPLRVETHCNAGSLACAFFGTATSVIYHAHERGLIEKVWVDETRPVDQGARLTAWEMKQAGVSYALICDNMAGSLMRAGQVDAVVVGADRVCANGDFANKIGTYPLAVLANYHNVPFYTAAPRSTFDMSLDSGQQIPIEERDPSEVRSAPVAGGRWELIAPEDAPVYNPAFDVTPHELLAGIITEEGVKRYA